MNLLLTLVLAGFCIATVSCGSAGDKAGTSNDPADTTAPAPENMANDREIHMLSGNVKKSYNLTKKNPSAAELKEEIDPEQELPDSRSSVITFNESGNMTSIRGIYRRLKVPTGLYLEGGDIHGKERKLMGYITPEGTSLIEWVTSSTDKQHASQTMRMSDVTIYIDYELRDDKTSISKSVTVNNTSGDTIGHQMIASYGWDKKEYLEVSNDFLKGSFDSVMVKKIKVDSASNRTKTLKTNLRTGKIEEVSFDRYEYY